MEKEFTCEPEYGGDGKSTWWYACSECHTAIDPGQKYCESCKRRILWMTLISEKKQ